MIFKQQWIMQLKWLHPYIINKLVNQVQKITLGILNHLLIYQWKRCDQMVFHFLVLMRNIIQELHLNLLRPFNQLNVLLKTYMMVPIILQFITNHLSRRENQNQHVDLQI